MYKIDSHQHFWQYSPAEYPWISERMSAIRRDFFPPDLKAELTGSGIDAAISVQASQTIAETRWLLELARENDFLLGVVGWVPLIGSNVADLLGKLAHEPKLVGIRHILHDEPDDFYMLRDDFNRGIRELRLFKLPYDILIFERHLSQTITFVDRHPDQIFIVDHLAKPRAKDLELSPWRENIEALARRPNVYCKLSGLVTEAEWNSWSEAELRPYIEVVLTAFEPRRVMFGSDWPVCLVAASYSQWVETVANAISRLSIPEQERIWSGTAGEVYRIL